MNEPESRTAVKFTIVAAVTVILSILCSMIPSAYSIINFKRYYSDFNAACTASVSAVVSEISKSADGSFPVYAFTYEGKEYTASGADMGEEAIYQPGDAADILIEPANPYHVYDPRNDILSDTLKELYTALIIRAVIIAAVIIIAIAVVRHFRKAAGQQKE